MRHFADNPVDRGASRSFDWQVIARLLPFLWRYKARVIGALVLLVAAKVANVLVPVTLKYIIDAFDQKGGGVTVAVAVPLALAIGYGLLRFANVFFGELRDAVFARVAERALSDISLAVFRHLHSLDLAFHLDRRTGGISRDLERGNAGISFLLRSVVFSVVPVIIEVAMVAGVLAVKVDLWFGVIVLVGVMFYVAFSIWMTNRRTHYIREANQRDSDASTRAIDSLLNFETVKYFNNEGFEAQRYGEDLRRREDAKVVNFYSLAALNSGQALIIGLSVTAVMVFAVYRVGGGAMTVGDLAMVNGFILQVFMPLNILGFVYREIRRALTDVEAMFELMDIRPQIADRDDAVPYRRGLDGIRFEDVRFGYSPDRSILRGVDFEVSPGEKVAIVGPSGAGKSTLARLLFRLYDVDGGRIAVDGTDIRALTIDSWRGAIGVVPQDTVLFNDTIEANIRYGNPEASDAELDRVIRLAHLDGFVARLPQGLRTRVGERGLKVSGGEKQRIAIARMLLKRPVLLVFDEATSSLDSASERAVVDALDEVARDHTTLVIAHRLSTVINADRIVVLADGRVVESGTHSELLAFGGHYRALWDLQHRADHSGAVQPV